MPSVELLLNSSSRNYANPSKIIDDYFSFNNNILSSELLTEYEYLSTQLLERYDRRTLPFPIQWAAEDGTSFLLYAITRIRKPKMILETGVANGHSTYFILNALLKNGFGSLHSIDISSKVGVLLEDGEKTNWNFHLISTKNDFNRVVNDINEVDFFMHDSNHSYRWQYLEYDTIYKKCHQYPYLPAMILIVPMRL